jgi:two-component system, OmpR family, KDP operon response regulator KdpE
MTTHRVLVVEDETNIRRALRINLTAHGYHVLLAPDGATALHAAAHHRPDVILLDLGLPDMTGFGIIENVRVWSTVPIIVLSARIGTSDTVHALDVGADDYITKPFGMAELLARLRAAVRRAAISGEETLAEAIIETPDFRVDLGTKKVARPDGSDVHLTPTEWGMLEHLVRRPGKLIGQRELLHIVWGSSYDKNTNYLRVYMAQLRRKLEPDPGRPRYLITEPGMGYRFEP